jgi:hypothetical protein
MALVNPNIAMSYRPTTEYQPRNALAEYAQIQQIMGGQRQAEVAEMQLEELRRDRDALNQIQAAIVAKGGPPDLGAAADAMLKNPKYFEQGLRIKETLDRQQLLSDYERRYGGGVPAMPAPEIGIDGYGEPYEAAKPSAVAPPSAMGQPLAPLGAPAAPANAMAPSSAMPDVNALRRQYALASRAGSPDAPVILKQIEAALKPDPSETRTMQLLGYPLTAQGYEAFRKAQMKEAQEGAPVAVIGPDGRPTLVTRAQAVGQTPFTPAAVQVLGLGPQRESAAAPSQKAPAGYRFTPSGDLEPIPGGPASPGLSPKDIQKREAAFPQATQSVRGFQTKSEQFIAELERLRDDPGLDQITGPIYGRTPSVSRSGSRAQALYDKIFAKGGFQALQDMREASKTGGALGNVSNEEGRRLEKSIVGGLDRTQNIADVQQGINDLIDEIRVSQTRVKDAYDTTYEYRAQRGAAAKQLSPQDKQALDWANSNPKDPRAAQIKARLGVQ